MRRRYVNRSVFENVSTSELDVDVFSGVSGIRKRIAKDWESSPKPKEACRFNIDRPGSKLRGFFQPPASVAQWRSPEKAAVFAAELRGAFIAHPIRRDGHIDIAE
jgi:hypothetical protein